MYLNVLKPWIAMPSQTSPARRALNGFTAEMITGMSGCSIGPGLKNGLVSLYW